LTGTCIAAISTSAGCAGRLEEAVSGDPTTEEVKSNAETIEYEKRYRNIDQYKGEYVHYEELRITDIVEGEGTKEYILTFPDGGFTDDRVLYGVWDGNPFKEKDHVEVWGEVKGLETYTSLTGEKTVPKVKFADIQLLEGA